MKTYGVVIRATITKTIMVCAENKEQAIENAQGEFSVLNTSNDENYEQDYLSIEEMED